MHFINFISTLLILYTLPIDCPNSTIPIQQRDCPHPHTPWHQRLTSITLLCYFLAFTLLLSLELTSILIWVFLGIPSHFLAIMSQGTSGSHMIRQIASETLDILYIYTIYIYNLIEFLTSHNLIPQLTESLIISLKLTQSSKECTPADFV